MNKRPILVTLISCVFIAAGITGIVYHASEFNAENPFESDLILHLLVLFLAIVSGFYAMRGKNWARWLMLVWITYHVILSIFHSLPELALHSALLVVIAYVLFRPEARAYFRRTTETPMDVPKADDAPTV